MSDGVVLIVNLPMNSCRFHVLSDIVPWPPLRGIGTIFKLVGRGQGHRNDVLLGIESTRLPTLKFMFLVEFPPLYFNNMSSKGKCL